MKEFKLKSIIGDMRFINEEKNPIDLQKLNEYAQAITTVCAGEYGDVWFRAENNEVFINVGDSHPFDLESLRQFMLDAISKDWDSQKEITITIENEVGPPDGFVKLSG